MTFLMMSLFDVDGGILYLEEENPKKSEKEKSKHIESLWKRKLYLGRALYYNAKF